MMYKKFFVYLILFCSLLTDLAYSVEAVMPNMSGSMKLVSTKNVDAKKNEYKYKTVLKRYKPYILTITNNNSKPVLLSSNTEVHFLLDEDCNLTSENRRAIYRKSRKRDMGRYYWVALPGALIAGGITGITFFIGAPIAAVVAVGMYVPTDKAVRTNVGISQDLFVKHDLPIRLEPKQTYNVRMLIPKKAEVEKVKITNISFDMKKMYEISFPVVSEEEL